MSGTCPPLRILVLAAVVAGAAACGGKGVRPLRPEYDLRAPDPEVRTRAIAHVGRLRDTTHVPTLVFLLDDEDAAVRASAAATLVSLTGHDTGYRPYMDPLERRRHQELWRAWWAAAGQPGASPPAPEGGRSDDARRR